MYCLSYTIVQNGKLSILFQFECKIIVKYHLTLVLHNSFVIREAIIAVWFLFGFCVIRAEELVYN